MKPRRSIRSDTPTRPPFKTSRWQQWRTRLELFHLRDYWWRILDYFEGSATRRAALYSAAVLLVTGLAAWHFAYPWWARRSAIRIAQQWLDAGQLHHAAEAVQRASQLAPDQPEPWRIAAELARLGGQNAKALEFARRAAELGPDLPDLQIGWAAAALSAGQPAEARTALEKAPAEAVAASAEAQRVLGELARRDLRLTEARNHFEAAVRVGGPEPINEIPLGAVLLRSKLPAEREQGLQLLAKRKDHKGWGAVALRLLLEDAIEHRDLPGMRRWAEALRTHPRVTVGDMPAWLLALSLADEPAYRAALAQLEKDHAVSPEAAAQLLGWLNKIGRHPDAVAWLRTLPPAGLQRPPLAPLAAEAFRGAGAWADLQAWTSGGNWGAETEFLRWSYGLLAARQLHDSTRGDELWRTLYNHAQLNTGHALFAASSLYAWGQTADAEALWWRAAEQDGRNAIEALGSLARHYQIKQDADGLYRAFRRLHLLQPADPDIANNFAFYALLLGREQRSADQTAEQIHRYHPANDNYLATRAFALTQQGRFADAVTLLQPKAALAPNSPALGFAYGLALAGVGKKNEARELLERLTEKTLTTAELELIRHSLGG